MEAAAFSLNYFRRTHKTPEKQAFPDKKTFGLLRRIKGLARPTKGLASQTFGPERQTKGLPGQTLGWSNQMNGFGGQTLWSLRRAG
jgi:hypothetical protein